MATTKRGLTAGALLPALLAGGGCYHAQPLDTGALLGELRRTDPVATAGGAAAPTTTGVGLGEDQSVAVALVWNRDLRAFRLTRGVAEGEVVTAGRLENPVLRTELTHLQDGVDGLGWGLRLSWRPPQPGVRTGRQAAAEAHLAEVDQEIGEREWALVCDVRAAFAALVAEDDEIRIAVDTVANRRKLVDLVTRRLARGGATRFDLDLTKLSLAAAERLEADQRLRRTTAANTLIALLGVGPPEGGAVAPVGGLDSGDTEAPLPAAAALEERSLANRPALAAARYRYDASEQTLRAETAARWPWFAFSAIPEARRQEFGHGVTDVSLGIDLTLPFLDTNAGRIKSAAAAREAARADVTSQLARLRTDIAQARATIEGQRALLRRLRSDISPLLADHDRLLAQALQAAELDLPSLLAAEDLVLRARTDLVTAQLALRQAHLALDRAVGTHIPLGAKY